MMRSLLANLCCGVLAAQGASFSFHEVPAGTVVEPDGKPVHGARVWIRVEAVGGQYFRARYQILRKLRLPVVFTSRDGGFVLPLTRAQRMLSSPGDGYFSLVVEKAGYQTWIEPLGSGLQGYLGSQVILRRLRPEDRFQVRVHEPLPGMKLLLRRRANPGAGNQPHVDLTRVLDVPVSGVMNVAMPLTPSPRAIVGHYNYLPLAREVQLLYPGRSSAAVPVRLGQKVVEIPVAKTVAGNAAQVVASDGRPLRDLRGLFRCPDGINRWFAVPDARLVRGSILQLLAVEASGCVVQTSPRVANGRLLLKRAPASGGPRSLRVVDEAGRPIPGAMVSCHAMESLRDPNNPWYGPGTAWHVRRANADGEVQVPDVVDRVPTVLMVQAPGYNRTQVTQPRSIVGRHEVRLTSGAHGSLQLTLQTGDGRPLAGAYLRFPDQCYALGGILDRIPRTDDTGTLRLDHLPPGRYSTEVIGERVIRKLVRIEVQRGAVQRVHETVERAPVLRGVTVAEDGSPVPFVPIQPSVSHRLRNLRIPGAQLTDSEGRFVLHGVPEQAINVSVRTMQQQFRWMTHPLDPEEAVNKIPATATSLLLAQMPAANPVQKVVTYVMNQRRQVISLPHSPPTVATLIRWKKDDNVSLFFQLAEGPPLRIDSEVMAGADVERLGDPAGPAILALGERPLRRRVPVQLDGIAGLEGDRLRLEISNIGGPRPYVYEDLGLGVNRDRDGKWWFLARDDSAYRGRLLHPQLLPVEFEVPAKTKTGEEEPVRVTLEKGVPLSFELHLGKQRLSDHGNLNVRVRDQARRNYVLYWQQPVGRVDHTVDEDNVLRLRCPMALQPGKLNVHLRLYGTRVSFNTNVTVTKGQAPMLLRFKDGKVVPVVPEALVPKAPAVPDKR